MRIFTSLALVAVGLASSIALAGPATADATGYDKLCLVTTAPGGKPLPTVCVYDPL